MNWCQVDEAPAQLSLTQTDEVSSRGMARTMRAADLGSGPALAPHSNCIEWLGVCPPC